LILQTHSHHVADYVPLYRKLIQVTNLRVHISIESDLDELPGLPKSASPVSRRMEAAATLKKNGVRVIATVAPLLPIADPEAFFEKLSQVADAVVIDHFIAGDGSSNGTRTQRTELPQAMAEVNPQSVELSYRELMIEVARKYFGPRVGVNIAGFAGRYLG
jgi:DNA repair photolyase